MNSQKSIRRALCTLVVTAFIGTWSSVSRSSSTPSQLGLCSATTTGSNPQQEDILHRLSNFSDTQTILDANETTISDSPANKLTVVKSSSCGVLWGDDTRPLRILVTCSEQYFPVFMNWLVHYHHICPIISNIFFICLDKGVEDRLLKIGLHCSHLFPYTTGYHKLWLARVRITQSLMRQGYDVLMTDVDAVWLRNPFPDIEKHIRQSDIIGSRASHPDRVYEQLGATVCMGFLYVKASAQSIVLWREFVNYMTVHVAPDDQTVLNVLLLHYGLHYPAKVLYVDSSTADSGTFMHKDFQYGVTLLPHTLFRRVCSTLDRASIMRSVVVHCISEKNRGSKHVSARAVNLWALRRDWANATAGGRPLDEYLRNISDPHAFVAKDGS